MSDHEPLALRSYTPSEALGECSRAISQARIEQDCETDDPVDEAINLHLAQVLAAGFTQPGLDTLPEHASNFRLLLLEKLPAHQQRVRVWHIGKTCLFVVSLRVGPRPARTDQWQSQTIAILHSVGCQAYDLAAGLEHDRSSYRHVVPRQMAERFSDYVSLLHQASMVLGLSDTRFADLVQLPSRKQTLDLVLHALSDFQKSDSVLNRERLQRAVAVHRFYNPGFELKLPVKPVE